MNPFSTAPLFLSLTAGFDEEKRNRQALLACIYAFGLLITFLFLGAVIIDLFRISVPGIRAEGGGIISVIGLRMLFPGGSSMVTSSEGQHELEIAFPPI